VTVTAIAKPGLDLGLAALPNVSTVSGVAITLVRGRDAGQRHAELLAAANLADVRG